MADGDGLPSDHHVARYCFGDRETGQTVSYKHFKLRPEDGGKLSTTWVECFHVADKSREAAARRLPTPWSGVNPADRIAFLKVKAIRAVVGSRGKLDVVEDGHPPANPCHAAIVNAGSRSDPELFDQDIATELSELAALDAPLASVRLRR